MLKVHRTHITHTTAQDLNLKDLNNTTKIELISLLSNSLLITPKKTKKNPTIKECFGAWATDETEYSTEEWMNDVEEMCKGKVDFIKELENL